MLVLVYGTYGSKENMITDKQIYSINLSPWERLEIDL